MSKLNVLGVMSGNGVCLYPFKKKFNIIGNWELRGVFYDKKQEQWNANFPEVPQYRSFKPHKKRVDVIIGHPDCGDSSILRMSRAKKAGNVAENSSILGFFNAITYYQPKLWMMENLPGLLKTFSKEEIEESYPDYHILTHVASVCHWGNSQKSRERLVIIGLKKSKYEKRHLKYFKLPGVDGSKLKFSQEFELGLGEDFSLCHVREPLDKTCNLYWGTHRQITYRRAKELWNSDFKGKARWYVGGKMNNQPGVSRNLPDTLPLTVRKQNRQFGTGGLVLSPREMARIQGCPDKFKLVYNNNQSIYWINKGRLTVTKTMPMDIARWFAKQILKLENNTTSSKL